jgi:hypothetical protein
MFDAASSPASRMPHSLSQIVGELEEVMAAQPVCFQTSALVGALPSGS